MSVGGVLALTKGDEMAIDPYEPQPEHRFAFALESAVDVAAVGLTSALEERIAMLAEAGAWGINLAEGELVGPDDGPHERAQRVAAVRRSLHAAGLRVPMVKANLAVEPLFKNGAFTSHDVEVRAFAVQRAMEAVELAVELGAEVVMLSGEREGGEPEPVKDPVMALKHTRECVDFLTHHVLNSNYDLRFVLEARAVEPHGDMYLPNTGAVLAFIDTLDHPSLVGVSPQLPAARTSGSQMTRTVAQVFELGKLYHLDLNGQKGSHNHHRRFGSDDIESAFYLVHFLERVGFEGPRHFHAHGFHVHGLTELRRFVQSSMRTYLILREKADRFEHDLEIQGMLAELRVRDEAMGAEALVFSPSRRDRLLHAQFDRSALRSRKLTYERLDELTMELLLGVR